MGAPLPDVPNVLRIFMEGWIDNDHVYKWGNVLHYTWSGTTPSIAGLTALANEVGTRWTIRVAPQCPSPTTLQTIQVQDLTSHTAASATVLGADIAGTRGDDSIP